MRTWLLQIHLENLLLRPIVGNSSKAHLIMSMPLINHIASLKSTLLYCLMLLQLGCYKLHFPLLASFVRFCQQGQHARWRLEVRRKAEKKLVFLIVYCFHQHLSSKSPSSWQGQSIPVSSLFQNSLNQPHLATSDVSASTVQGPLIRYVKQTLQHSPSNC